MDKPARIKVRKTKLEVCVDGHIASAQDTGVDAWMIVCACGEYTWEDGNFCIMCGIKLKENESDGWLCTCGRWIDDGLHCGTCMTEPPQGCPCSSCQEGPHIEDEDISNDVDF